MVKTTVKVSVLGLLEKGPRCYSELVSELERPDKTICVVLRDLAKLGLVVKDEKGRWAVTKEGRLELRRTRFVNAVLAEEDTQVLERLADLYAALKRKSEGGSADPDVSGMATSPFGGFGKEVSQRLALTSRPSRVQVASQGDTGSRRSDILRPGLGTCR